MLDVGLNNGIIVSNSPSKSVAFIAKACSKLNGYGTDEFGTGYLDNDGDVSIAPGCGLGHTAPSSVSHSGSKRNFTLYLSIKKLRKMKRRKINRMNKDLELFRRVKERRLRNPNRLIDIRKVNFINDKCNPRLMRLPVSPLVDLNGLVPFKTVPEMTSQIPFNPAPVLHSIGYKFKPREKGKYERFCEPYPMDEILQVIDARSLGAISRMSGTYKITGDGTRIPTPMDSKPVPPGASVGKGYGFGLTKKPEPKRKPMPLSNFDAFAPDPDSLVDSLEELETIKKQASSYVDRMAEPTVVKGNRDGKATESVGACETEIAEMAKQASKGREYESVPADSLNVPFLDDACNEGDIMRNPRYLGEYRHKYWYHPFYGNPTMPGEERKLVEEYNRANPDKPLVYEEYKVDLIYCHSNGTIVYLGENKEPYTNEAEDFVLEGEDPREPRFVIQACAGFIKEQGLQLGQTLPCVNREMRERYFDNIFFIPKSVRSQYTVHLPDGTLVQ
ncbi:uncharacterized protein BXIN_1078 [Babesia sp. Xinjiang]|uniref:uncharacterized protein n=1 Tax=Babesia sp. Xinjiang TaxID=462227 RepID=UPI000A25AF4D|nr:uncharacterized protein BXIN_1078 [Babesia sp. Xinjiang]ORM42275.1 hypothetical protein BXIN_1078 [Babesia sp. Xinjiang]